MHVTRDNLLVLIILPLLLLFALQNPEQQSDSVALSNSLDLISACLTHQVFTNCNIVHFPLFQFLVGWPLRYFIGLTPEQIVYSFTVLNALSICLTILFFISQKHGTRDRLTMVLLLILSPFIYYSRTSFNEVTAAAIILMAIFTLIKERSFVLIWATFFFATITKETLAPFLFLEILACFALFSLSKKTVSAAIFAVFLGSIANLLFNFFRFGSPFNKALLSDYYHVKSINIWASHLIALLISPSGGFIFFIPAIFLLPLFYKLELRSSLCPKSHQRNLGLVLLALGFATQLGGISTWFSPMGWATWGGRLLLPVLPATFFIVLNCLSLRNSKPTLRLMLPCTLACLFFWIPQISVNFHAGIIHQFFSATQGPCSGLPTIEQSVTQYHDCQQNQLWRISDSQIVLAWQQVDMRTMVFALILFMIFFYWSYRNFYRSTSP